MALASPSRFNSARRVRLSGLSVVILPHPFLARHGIGGRHKA